MEFYSFLPLRSRQPGGSFHARSGSALPLPPLLPPAPAPGSPQSWCGHWARLRGWGGGTAAAWGPHGRAPTGLRGLQPKGAVAPSADWVVGPDPGPAGAKRVLSLVLGCLQTSPQRAPTDTHPCIPPALLAAEKLRDARSPGSWRRGRHHPASRQLSSFPPISPLDGSKGRAAAGWVVK